MGYDTCYNLSWEGESPTMDEVVRLLTLRADAIPRDNPDFQIQANSWKSILEHHEPTRWYEHREHLAMVSRRWPQVTFLLEGEGEDRDDNWREYHRDGRVQVVEGRILFPPPDPQVHGEAPKPDESRQPRKSANLAHTTRFNLTWDNRENPTIEEIAAFLFQEATQDNAPASWKQVLQGEERHDWRNHQQDLAKVSANWPRNSFILNAQGEESGDIWREYHINGLVHEAATTISIEDFDPAKLRPPSDL